MKAILWAAAALSDLARIDEWHADRDPDYADRIGFLAIKSARFLQDHPLAGPALANAIRKWPVAGTDYRLFYTVSDEAIEIVRLLHAKEDREALF